MLLLYNLTYLLTPWRRVLLEKLTGLQLVKKFPAFHRTRRFITALTSVRHLSLSWASPIQPTYPHPTSWRSVLIFSNHLRLGLPSYYCTTRILYSKTLTGTYEGGYAYVFKICYRTLDIVIYIVANYEICI